MLPAGSMSNVALTYRFTMPDSSERVFNLELDRDTAVLVSRPAGEPAAWTEMAFNQCSGCPFQASEVSHCPAAVQLAAVIDGFTDLVSYDKVRVTVESEERSVAATLSAQQ